MITESRLNTMFLARVEGSVVATKKDPSMNGRKLLLVRPQLVDDKDPTKFRGFFAGEGNRTYIPNQFFDVVIPNETLAVTKVVGSITNAWMPWLGKKFYPEEKRGENTLTKSARMPAKLLWRSAQRSQKRASVTFVPYPRIWRAFRADVNVRQTGAAVWRTFEWHYLLLHCG